MVRRAALLLLLGLSLARADQAERGGEVDWLAACPAPLAEGVGPLVLARKAEGLRVEVLALDPTQGAEPARNRILERVRAARPRYLLLVGDADRIPAFTVDAAITDRPYGDTDGDGLPEVSVGRIPARDGDGLARVVANLLRYEREAPAGTWRRECALLAGEGRFGAVADAAIEQVFTRAVADEIHPGYDVELLWASAGSPFCFPAEQLPEYVGERIERGALLMAWVGHGQVGSLDELRVRQPDGKERRYDILDVSRAPALRTTRSPVFLALACYTGRFTAKETSIGEALLLSGQGPIAFYGATEISHPIPNGLLGKALVRQLLAGVGPIRLGPAVDRAEAELVRPTGERGLRTLALGLGGFADPQFEAGREMPRHVDMYNLLGDPATRLQRPGEAIELQAPREGDPGKLFPLRGKLPAGLREVALTLEAPRDREVPAGPPGETPRERFARANDRVLARARLEAGPDGAFRGQLRVPAAAPPGTLHLKAFACEGSSAALGAVEVRIR